MCTFLFVLAQKDDTELARATFSKFYETTLAVLRTIIDFKLKKKLKCIETISKEGKRRLIGFDLSTLQCVEKAGMSFVYEEHQLE